MPCATDAREARSDDPKASDSPIEAYICQPLLPGHIRLLCIFNNLEEFHIIHTAFDSAPACAAVSYTRDDQPRDRDLLVKGTSLKVIKNIPVFLPYLVNFAKAAYFWIDGICLYLDRHRTKYHGNLRLGFPFGALV
ncbi:hypothetical protein BDZ45DRAFT_671432 [Acephala macrosclerotiorum]|nr:hypothetical protein BDZ45DRAFT_671432 [Acephala macrosclerotiorum]